MNHELGNLAARNLAPLFSKPNTFFLGGRKGEEYMKVRDTPPLKFENPKISGAGKLTPNGIEKA
jgi:hypothetical protein